MFYHDAKNHDINTWEGRTRFGGDKYRAYPTKSHSAAWPRAGNSIPVRRAGRFLRTAPPAFPARISAPDFRKEINGHGFYPGSVKVICNGRIVGTIKRCRHGDAAALAHPQGTPTGHKRTAL